jgi:hypothetical protein
MSARPDIKQGSVVLVLTSDGWRSGKVQVVYRDKHGPIAVVVDGKRYNVSQFKKR